MGRGSETQLQVGENLNYLSRIIFINLKFLHHRDQQYQMNNLFEKYVALDQQIRTHLDDPVTIKIGV